MTRWDPEADDFIEDDPEEHPELAHLRSRCEACGCDPCVCPDSTDFCDICGNLEKDCTCGFDDDEEEDDG